MNPNDDITPAVVVKLKELEGTRWTASNGITIILQGENDYSFESPDGSPRYNLAMAKDAVEEFLG